MMDAKGTSPVSIRRLLVALDGSRLAETSLPLVSTLARALGAEVNLLHVLETEPPTTVHGEPHLTGLAEATAYLDGVAARLRGEGLSTTWHVHEAPQRDVASGIAAHAAELAADLLILCAHGRGGLRDLLLGRVAQQVVGRGEHPVLVVPAPTERDLSRLQRVEFPVDQVGEAAVAEPLVRALARALLAQVRLVTVVPTPDTVRSESAAAATFLPGTASRLLNWAEEEARSALERLAADFRGLGLEVQVEVRRGDTVRELRQSVEAYDPDLLVMATHGHVGWEALWKSSVGPRLLESSIRPVLLVPVRD